MYKRTIVLTALLAGPAALAAEPSGPPPHLEFSVASLQGNVLAAELPRGIEVDWESLAKQTIRGIDLDDPTPEQRKKIAASYGKCDLEPQLHFEAPLPPEIALYSFYLVTDSGVAPLRAANDAIIIDSDNKTIDSVFDETLRLLDRDH